MGHVQVTIKVAKPNINSKMGVTVTKTGPSAVFVSDLKPGFCGQQAGLMFNDIILQVNGENVETPVQCTDLFKGSQELIILVERESAVDTGHANTPQPQAQQVPSPASKAQQPAACAAEASSARHMRRVGWKASSTCHRHASHGGPTRVTCDERQAYT